MPSGPSTSSAVPPSLVTPVADLGADLVPDAFVAWRGERLQLERTVIEHQRHGEDVTALLVGLDAHLEPVNHGDPHAAHVDATAGGRVVDLGDVPWSGGAGRRRGPRLTVVVVLLRCVVVDLGGVAVLDIGVMLERLCVGVAIAPSARSVLLATMPPTLAAARNTTCGRLAANQRLTAA